MFEINLVPAVKTDMLKAMKVRNIVLFVCLIVGAVAIGIVAILGLVVSGQNLAMSNQDNRIDMMSNKITNYESLSDFLTIQEQLNKISDIESNKKVLSRVFNVLNALLPKGEDKISISELTVDLDASTLNFDGQADAGVEPLIDYRVLESFKKGVGLMKYDYGRYVDENGAQIPVRCIEEIDESGNLLNEEGNIYAIWRKGERGCDPSKADDENTNEESEENAEEVTNETSETSEALEMVDLSDEITINSTGEVNAIETNTDDANVEEVKIYRTPQYGDWYKNDKMTLDGVISGVPHFESDCITYSGSESEGRIKWTANNECMLSSEEAAVRDSSNGRDSSGNLVLRFSTTIVIDPAVFAFSNKHVMAIGPEGQNVTDSYVQIEGMFEERAEDCKMGDVDCMNTANSTGGDE